jgi:hydrogenase nickel incorporation protein HypB
MSEEMIKLERDIFEANRKIAEENRETLKRHGVKAYDILGAIGSGKTMIIERMVDLLQDDGIRCGAIAGDVAGEEDYKKIRSHGIPVENVNTGKECHLDANLVRKALNSFDLDSIDLLFIENVGNLVCPVDFPLGSEKRIVVISVTEGDDMVKKHPVIFSLTDVCVLNKVDLAKYIDVDPDIIVKDFERINPGGRIILTDAKHGDGIKELIEIIR